MRERRATYIQDKGMLMAMLKRKRAGARDYAADIKRSRSKDWVCRCSDIELPTGAISNDDSPSECHRRELSEAGSRFIRKIKGKNQSPLTR